MLCTVELMLAGLCINIPMLRPFYLQWRAKYKNSSMSASGRISALKRSNTGGMGSVPNPGRPGHYTQWMELEDKDQMGVTITHDDASSERKLTADSPPPPFDAIQVQKDFVITRH
jgi:hypothetical protein